LGGISRLTRDGSAKGYIFVLALARIFARIRPARPHSQVVPNRSKEALGRKDVEGKI